MANEQVRNAAKNLGVKFWRVADELGMADATLSRKLRYEFSDQERERVLDIIRKLAEAE